MKDLIYDKIHEYAQELKDFEVYYSNRLLSVDELISLYEFRNKLDRGDESKQLIQKILHDLILIKNDSIQYIKFVTARNGGTSRLYFFSEDYSKIFCDFTFPLDS